MKTSAMTHDAKYDDARRLALLANRCSLRLVANRSHFNFRSQPQPSLKWPLLPAGSQPEEALPRGGQTRQGFSRESVLDTLQGVFDTVEGVPNTLKGVLNEVEDVLDTAQDVSSTLSRV